MSKCRRRDAIVAAMALRALIATAAALAASSTALAAAAARYVIQISVDGLGSSYLQKMIEEDALPNFARLEAEGAWTGNARNDDDFTITLPNHTTMLTGRPVRDHGAARGHEWVENGEPGELTLHSNAHEYVTSTFDVAHDHGLSTGLFASKSKFVLYKQSYEAAGGAPDETGEDDGRNKIDVCVIDEDPLAMTCRFVLDMAGRPVNYSFVHFRNPDSAGHAFGWGGAAYCDAVRQVDTYLGLIFELVDSEERLRGKTALIVTADHGGFERGHSDSTLPLNYTIPFLVWGPHAGQGADLYALNEQVRSDPGAERGDGRADARAPIRNGDGANLALGLLGLGPVPDSSINPKQDLVIVAAAGDETESDEAAGAGAAGAEATSAGAAGE